MRRLIIPKYNLLLALYFQQKESLQIFYQAKGRMAFQVDVELVNNDLQQRTLHNPKKKRWVEPSLIKRPVKLKILPRQ